MSVQAAHLERSATSLRREPVASPPWDARGIWRGLMHGEWFVAESFAAGDRRVLIIRRNEEVSDPRGLSSSESRVLALATEGHTDKRIAQQLGVAEGTASACLCRALRKLKISGRIELVRQLGSGCRSDVMAGMKDNLPALVLPMPTGARTRYLGADLAILDIPLLSVTLPAELSDAEQEVALLVFEGATNEQIARARRASVKTVSNQLGSIFRKLKIYSRVELVLYLQRGPGDGG